jgi:predicted molibdopterin-dependent oxidoreductase YjgC
MAAVQHIIAVDTFASSSSQRADVLLPAAAFGEKDGTTTNLEGRVTQLNRKVNVHGTARPDWMIALELADYLGHDLGVGSVQEVHQHLVSKVSAFADATRAALAINPDGILLRRSTSNGSAVTAPAVPDRPGFGYRLVVSRKLYDNGSNVAHSASLAPLATGSSLHMHPLDLDRLGASVGDQVKVSSDRTSIVMPIVSDESVTRGTVWAAWAQSGSNIGELIDSSRSVNDVKVETL